MFQGYPHQSTGVGVGETHQILSVLETDFLGLPAASLEY